MALENLRILRLHAEQVKRLKVVEITPTGEIVTITGKNGHGKTSVLDCILWALGGKGDIQFKPIREGEERAFIQVDLGNDEGLQLQVTRRFTAQEDGNYTTSLKVVNQDGFRPEGEQNFLSALIGALSFDPGEFARAKPDEQVKLLKALIPDADFDSIAVARKTTYEARTDAGREEKRLRAAGMAIPLEEDLPPLVDTEALADLLAKIGTAAREYEAEIGRRMRLRDAVDSKFGERDRKRARAEELRNEAATLDGEADDLNAEGVELEEEIADLEELKAPEDAAAIRTKLTEGELVARKHSRQKERVDLLAQADAKAGEITALSAKIDQLDKDVLDLIAGADLPVSGLAIKEDRVFLRGVPFEQASDAEQIRAALALAIAANPRLRVIRIRDGERFDDDAMAVIREVAAEENFQIWVEAVRGFGDPEEIIMENGEVKNG